MVSGGENTNRLDARSAAAVRAGLDRVLASDVFRGAPQLSAFLSFIVERAIEGRGAELKGYTVAVEAFGRPPDFDPQADPIVRVEAGRLRKALGQYYLGDGLDDPVRITIPVGAYVPNFEFVDALSDVEPTIAAPMTGEPPVDEPATPTVPVAVPDKVISQRWLMMACLALLLGLLTLLVWYRMASHAPASAGRVAPVTSSEVAREVTVPPASNQLPVLAVLIKELPPNPVSAEIARRVLGVLIDAIARFDDVVTVKAPSESGAAAEEGADYVLELSAARFGDVTESSARLRAVKDGRIVWTTSSSRPQADNPADPAWLEIARRNAIRLVEPFGIIHADFRQAATSPAIRCIFMAFDFRRTVKAEDHLAARTCLEDVLERDPTFHPAWSQLAFLILDEYTSDLNPLPGPPLDRALGAALNAVRLSPSSARAQQAMMDVLFARGQIEDALAAGRSAMARNPFDPDIMADLGARLVQLNRPAEGLPLLQRAIALSNGGPPWYDFFAFLAARMTGANKLAESYASKLLADEGSFSLLGRAMQCATAGDDVCLATALSSLAAKAPLFRVDPRLFLARKGFSPAVAERIVSDLGPSLIDRLKVH